MMSRIPVALTEQTRWNITSGDSKKPLSIEVSPPSDQHGKHPLSTFETAQSEAVRRGGHVVFKFGATAEQMDGKPLGDLLCIDLDGCLDEAGAVLGQYQDIVDRLLPVAWCERSLSKRGLHFVLRTTLDVKGRKSSLARDKDAPDDGKLHFDLFFEGHAAYGVCMTGDEYPGCNTGELGQADDVVIELLEYIDPPKKTLKKQKEPTDKQVRLVAEKFNQKHSAAEIARRCGAIEIKQGQWHHGHAGSTDTSQPNMSIKNGSIWLYSSKNHAVDANQSYSAFGYACAMSGKTEQEFAAEVAGGLGLTLGAESKEVDPNAVTNEMVLGVLKSRLKVEEDVHGLSLDLSWDGSDKINGIDINRPGIVSALEDYYHAVTGSTKVAGKCAKAVSVMLESPRQVNRFRDALDKLEPIHETAEIEKFVRCVAKPEDVEWLLEYWKIFLVALVAFQYDQSKDRCCQVTPILSASQGMGKSHLLRKLLEPFGLYPSTFSGFPDISNKDNIPLLLTSPLVELSEICGNNKTQVGVIKSFLTSREVRWRRPYAAKETRVIRATLYIGTTNEYQIFSDKTGSRRFFVMDLDDVYSAHEDKQDRIKAFQAAINAVDFKQVIAEAKALFESGFKWHTTPSAEAVRRNEEAAKAFTMESDQEEKVWAKRSRLSGRTMTRQQIYEICGIDVASNAKNPQFAEFLKSSGLLERPPYMSNGRQTFKFRDFSEELQAESKAIQEEEVRLKENHRNKCFERRLAV